MLFQHSTEIKYTWFNLGASIKPLCCVNPTFNHAKWDIKIPRASSLVRFVCGFNKYIKKKTFLTLVDDPSWRPQLKILVDDPSWIPLLMTSVDDQSWTPCWNYFVWWKYAVDTNWWSNKEIPSNMTMHVAPPGHLVAKFLNNASGATLWPNF